MCRKKLGIFKNIIETLMKYRYGEIKVKITHIPDFMKNENHSSLSFYLLFTRK
jgi:hypothetical protein